MRLKRFSFSSRWRAPALVALFIAALTFVMSTCLLILPESLEASGSSFEELKEYSYEPTARYRIRDFSRGTGNTLDGQMASLNDRFQSLANTGRQLKRSLERADKKNFLSVFGEWQKEKQELRSVFHELQRSDYQSFLQMRDLISELNDLEARLLTLRQLQSL